MLTNFSDTVAELTYHSAILGELFPDGTSSLESGLADRFKSLILVREFKELLAHTKVSLDDILEHVSYMLEAGLELKEIRELIAAFETDSLRANTLLESLEK